MATRRTGTPTARRAWRTVGHRLRRRVRKGAWVMSGNNARAEAWTSAMREQQSSLDLGADLGPADPTAYTMRRPIPEPMPTDRHGPARIIALANQKGGVGK